MEFNSSIRIVVYITRPNFRYHLTAKFEKVRDTKVSLSEDVSWKKDIINKYLKLVRLSKKNIPTKWTHRIICILDSSKTSSRICILNVDPIHTVQHQLIRNGVQRSCSSCQRNYSTYGSVTIMLNSRTLETRRADSLLIIFYKIVHGLIAVLVPCYVKTSNRFT